VNPGTLRDLLGRINDLERLTPRLRVGVVTATNPLSVALGGSTTAYTNIRALGASHLNVGDQVTALARDKDLIILARTDDGGLVHYVGDASDPIAPSFASTWLNYDTNSALPSTPATLAGRGRSVGFYRAGGRVWLTGVAKSGTNGTSIFSLPVGFRPPFDTGDMIALSNSSTALITPMADGRVIATNLAGNVTVYVELFGLSFMHA
jgi:hypothetical protein